VSAPCVLCIQPASARHSHHIDLNFAALINLLSHY
jgi:hypothetical protein